MQASVGMQIAGQSGAGMVHMYLGRLLTAQEVYTRCRALEARGVPMCVLHGSLRFAQDWKADMNVIANYTGSHWGLSRARAALLRWEDRA